MKLILPLPIIVHLALKSVSFKRKTFPKAGIEPEGLTVYATF